MPPLEWSIVQSTLLSLVVPTFGVAAFVMALACWLIRSERYRSAAASIALIAGLSAGLGMQNMKGELIPFLAVQRVNPTIDQEEIPVATKSSSSWEFETGWRSLFAVPVAAVLAEIAIELTLLQHSRFRSAAIASGLMAMICAIGLTPWDLSSSRPFVCGLMAMVILFNWTTLRLVGQMHFGPCIPLIMAIVWGGCATVVVVLSHSARFADLGILISCALSGVGLVAIIKWQRLKTVFAGPAAFIPGLMLADRLNTYSEIPVASFVLVALAPGLFFGLHLAKVRTWFEARPIVLAIAFLIPCVVAAGLAIRAEF